MKLNERLGQAAHGKTRFTADRVLFEDLERMVLDHYRANSLHSLGAARRRFRVLSRTFAGWRAVDITTDRLTAFRGARQVEGVSASTINQELGLLRRGFVLAIQAGRLDTRPYTPILKVQNARKGFLQWADLELLLRELPEDLRPLFGAAYITGWRVRSELTTRQWRHVDFTGGWIRIEPGEDKNGDGREFPLTPYLRSLLEEQRRRTDALERELGRIVPWVFWSSIRQGVQVAGSKIGRFEFAWTSASRRAGLEGRIPHDLRRTAVLNLERAGVARSVAMKITGHRTAAVYARYAIPEAGLLQEAGAKLQAVHEAQRGEERRATVVGFGKPQSRKGQKKS